MSTHSLPVWLERQLQTSHAQLAHLPNALLLVDAQNDNAPLLAKAIMKNALCLQAEQGQACRMCRSCRLLDNGNHPDVIFNSEALGVDEVRALQAEMMNAASISRMRIVYLHRVDSYNDFALNALLKTLEEPPEDVHFLLSAPMKRSVKPTILSRARVMNVARASEQEALDYCLAQGMKNENATKALAFYHDNPFLALEMKEGETLSLEALVRFFISPTRNLNVLNCLDTMGAKQALATLLRHLEQLLMYLQLDKREKNCQNMNFLQEMTPYLVPMRLHSLYYALQRLSLPFCQRIDILGNIKALLLDFSDKRNQRL